MAGTLTIVIRKKYATREEADAIAAKIKTLLNIDDADIVGARLEAIIQEQVEIERKIGPS